MSVAKLDEVFAERWKRLESELNHIRDGKLLPVSYRELDGKIAELTLNEIESQLASLKSKLFTIAVCGVVKAGKSTFLNSLLFGDTVLPTFATPMTAKLTFIRHTDEPNYFEATFYSIEEMAEIEKNLPRDARAELAERKEYSYKMHGVKPDSVLTSGNNKIQKVKDLTELDQYVSVPCKTNDSTGDVESKAGRFTPYVKSVCVYIRNENLRNIQVVDTPGLNDPNSINSNETRQWIKEAHAIVYLLTPRGVDSEDVRFFDTYFPAANAENRVFVINKIDSEPNYQSTVDHLYNLGREPEYQKRGMFGKSEKICPYSSLMTLLKQKIEAGKQLTEDETWEHDRKKDADVDPRKVAEVISQTLYSREGQMRINRGIDEVKKVYAYNKAWLENEIIQMSGDLSDCRETVEQLKREVDELRKFQSNLLSKQKEITEESRIGAKKALETCMGSVIYTFDDIGETIKIKSNQYRSRSQVKSLFPWDVKQAVEAGITNYNKNALGPLYEDLKQIMILTKKRLDALLKGNGIEEETLGYTIDITEFGLAALMGPARQALERLTGDLIHEATSWFRWTETNVDKSLGVGLEVLSDVKGKVEQCLVRLQESTDKQVKEYIDQTRQQAEDRCSSKERNLAQSQEDRDKTAAKLETKLKARREKLDKLDIARQDMASRFGFAKGQ